MKQLPEKVKKDDLVQFVLKKKKTARNIKAALIMSSMLSVIRLLFLLWFKKLLVELQDPYVCVCVYGVCVCVCADKKAKKAEFERRAVRNTAGSVSMHNMCTVFSEDRSTLHKDKLLHWNK